MHIFIVTDAWHPQVNGVVRSLEATAEKCRAKGARVDFLTPDRFATIPLPTYPDIRLAIALPAMIGRHLAEHPEAHIHIATEGPLGLGARAYCRDAGRPFTTSYHTRFPEYLAARLPVPLDWSYAWLRRFHNSGIGTMVATSSIEQDLSARGFQHLMRWSRGVDADLFHPGYANVLDLPRPIFLTVGRVAVEKNIESFLALDLPGSKAVVGDGPARETLMAAYPDAHFLGLKTGKELAQIYASADALVFPSRTDTFGIVLLEALASGLPIAAHPVPGPLDVIGDDGPGCLSEDLREACLAALNIPREAARNHALKYSWDASAQQFMDNIMHAREGRPTEMYAG
ncbi:glycosyltransferase family 4 protein [Methylovirgula sp. 4M-Z18]|uniref:glycosyltransferase family 4 protein n=1 Tax=Methylovirgula sp. 4M-Z18 TaxID=2293567 RepID=UPI000E2F5B3D|nr:glycosyltransferase family 1 protein [Methylovirgula sp. 4M-Z18]RFB80057.1 glycosyltransferase family 1 protein [Methylovirgula sp. 4M-Z18]